MSIFSVTVDPSRPAAMAVFAIGDLRAAEARGNCSRGGKACPLLEDKMTATQKQNLKPGDVVHTKGGKYVVVQMVMEPTNQFATPLLVRCFRMGDAAKYSSGVPPAFKRKTK